MKKNDVLEIFRIKAALLLGQWADRMRVFVVENQIAGLSPTALKDMRTNPKSKWAGEREALTKALKKEAAGLVNRVHFRAYFEGRGR